MVSIDSLVEDIVALENQAKTAAEIEKTVRAQFDAEREALQRREDMAVESELASASLLAPAALMDEAKMLRGVLLDAMVENGLKSVDTPVAKVSTRHTAKAVPLKASEWWGDELSLAEARYRDIRDLVRIGRFKFLDIKGGVDLAKDLTEITVSLGNPLETIRVEESTTVVITKK